MRNRVLLGISLAAVTVAAPVRAQLADYYRGTVVNGQLRDRPATLEFSIFPRSDSQTSGWLGIGRPLGGSGLASVVARGLDSLYLVSVSQTGDTIVWASETRTGTIGGRYWIRGGPYVGQGGTWRLAPHRRLPVATLVLTALFMAVAALLVVYAVGVYSCERWWRWQEARPMEGITEVQLRAWRSIGGWLAWIVVTNSILVLYLLARGNEIGEWLGPSWMFGAALPEMRPVLLVEAAAHLFQILGVSLGLLLIIRRSPIAPPYWVALLLTMAGYAMYDLLAVANMLPSIGHTFGSEASSAFLRRTQTARDQNTRLIFFAAIWSLYWLRSRRVRLRFSPNRATVLHTATPPSLGDESAFNHVNEGSCIESSQPASLQQIVDGRTS